jgi:hypothetical protein
MTRSEIPSPLSLFSYKKRQMPSRLDVGERGGLIQSKNQRGLTEAVRIEGLEYWILVAGD